jgi:16S rRNA G1207 methylase RsmC
MSIPLTMLYEDAVLHHPPTHEELQLIHNMIFLPLALAVVERNRSELERKARSLRSIFTKAADLMIAKMKSDLTASTGQLARRSITVCLYSSTHQSAVYRYNCRGFEEQMFFDAEYIRSEINRKVAAYSSSIFNRNVSS